MPEYTSHGLPKPLGNENVSRAAHIELVDAIETALQGKETPSGAQAKVDAAIATHSADTTKHITDAERTAWNNAEQNAKNFVLQANPNLLKNSSFQFGLAGWISTCPHFGIGQTLNLGSFVDHWNSVPANEWHILEGTQRIPCWNGGLYVTLSAWFYSLGQTHGNIYMELYGNGSPQILGQLRADLNKDWHRKADTFYIPSGTTEIWVKFVVGGDPQGMPQGSKAVTRIKLEYGTQATPYSEEGNFIYVRDGKLNIRNAITNKGVTVADADGDGIPTFNELVSGVNSIPTGKKWATGSFSPVSYGLYTISGLQFRPSVVWVYSTAFQYGLVLVNSTLYAYNGVKGIINDVLNNGGTGATWIHSGDGSYTINNDGFTILIASNHVYYKFNYYAVE